MFQYTPFSYDLLTVVLRSSCKVSWEISLKKGEKRESEKVNDYI